MNLVILVGSMILSTRVVLHGLAAYPGMHDLIGMPMALGMLLIGALYAVSLPVVTLRHLRSASAKPKG